MAQPSLEIGCMIAEYTRRTIHTIYDNMESQVRLTILIYDIDTLKSMRGVCWGFAIPLRYIIKWTGCEFAVSYYSNVMRANFDLCVTGQEYQYFREQYSCEYFDGSTDGRVVFNSPDHYRWWCDNITVFTGGYITKPKYMGLVNVRHIEIAVKSRMLKYLLNRMKKWAASLSCINASLSKNGFNKIMDNHLSIVKEYSFTDYSTLYPSLMYPFTNIPHKKPAVEKVIIVKHSDSKVQIRRNSHIPTGDMICSRAGQKGVTIQTEKRQTRRKANRRRKMRPP